MKISSYKKLIKSVGDLVTPYEQTRAGFVALALEKNRMGTPYVEEAKALKVAASRVKRPKNLVAFSLGDLKNYGSL